MDLNNEIHFYISGALIFDIFNVGILLENKS